MTKGHNHPCGSRSHFPVSRGDVTKEPFEEPRDRKSMIFMTVSGPPSPCNDSKEKDTENMEPIVKRARGQQATLYASPVTLTV